MTKRSLAVVGLTLAALLLADVRPAVAQRQSSLNTGPPTNLHRRHVVNQAKKKAARGEPVRRHYGVWISGGFDRTVQKSRASSYRRGIFRRR
ncbi:MAG: hypothetical protein AAGA92_07585 [Planctomycetota bacterium]